MCPSVPLGRPSSATHPRLCQSRRSRSVFFQEGGSPPPLAAGARGGSRASCTPAPCRPRPGRPVRRGPYLVVRRTQARLLPLPLLRVLTVQLLFSSPPARAQDRRDGRPRPRTHSPPPPDGRPMRRWCPLSTLCEPGGPRAHFTDGEIEAQAGRGLHGPGLAAWGGGA